MMSLGLWSAPTVAQAPTAGAAPECAASASCARKPTPRGNPSNWLTVEDYPAGATGNGKVALTLVVDTAGKVMSCVVTQSSGLGLFDTTACSVLQRRARFNPALDAYGRPVVGNYATRASFTQGDCSDPMSICIDPNQ